MPIRNVDYVTMTGAAALKPVVEKQVAPTQKQVEGSPEQKAQDAVLPDVLAQAIEEANELFKHVRPDIKFVVDADSHEVVMMMVEPETENVLKRYPSEQALFISNAIAASQASETVTEQGSLRPGGDSLLGLLVTHKI